ncbi:MFS transporter [Streptomyces iranensis]|uniref:DHA2 family multidrug resistance protein-like MFS transporter n=1 Tax=Streptomyces iranensis TaxID=576784 RepID=A0A060ZRT2_9ACTN|nr:MFS transporter [Streptomyces iranensis]MBP2065472.1 DHA2 family multidrug resistance protein-like MFS transporter [Streptomyces iranensis]CDR08815.1 major facilitator superfamily MFS_1 [Streptomyces iranensis]
MELATSKRTRTAETAETPGAPRRWAVLAVLCPSLLLTGIDLTVTHAAVPSLTRELHPSGVRLLWIVDVYSLTVAALLVTCGTLGDRIGRKLLVLSGFALFGLASTGAAFAQTSGQLIAARALLGAGTAMIMSSTAAIIRVVFPDRRERTIAIGLWTAAHSVGAAVGPLVGGALLQRWWWGSVFLLNVPVVAVILVAGARLIPESRNPAPRPWDLPGVALSAVGLTAVVYALKQAGADAGGGASGMAVTVAVGAVGVALLAVFVRRQRRSPQPLLDFSLFADRRFTTATVCVLGCFGCYAAMLFFLTQWFQLIGGASPLRAGLALLPLAAANAAGAVVAPWTARRWGDRWAMTGALAGFSGALFLLCAGGGPARYGVAVVAMLASGLGAGVVMTLASDAIMASADPDRAGEAAAIQETSFELGAGLSIAALGTVLTATYRAVLPSSMPGIPAADRQAAGESIGAANAIADRLAPSSSDLLRATARDAYARGFTVTVLSAALALAATATLAALLLRPPRRHGRR